MARQEQVYGADSITIESGLEIIFSTPLDNEQYYLLESTALDFEVQPDQTTKTTWNPWKLPYQLVLVVVGHRATQWNLVSRKGRPIANTPENIKRRLPHEDFQDAAEKLFEKFGRQIMGIPADLEEDGEDENDDEDDNSPGVPGPSILKSPAPDADEDDEEEEDAS